jgi:phospholipid/cholesterol/gamma-HCH transport system ATP-binding protein
MTAATPSRPTLEARGIVNRFGAQTVHDGLDLEIEAGEVLGIAGGSGSGKSVLLRTLAGLHRPQAGEALAAGRPVASLLPAERAAFFGVLFQHGALFSSLTVAENIMLPLREHTRLTREEQEALAAVKLSLAGLDADSGAKLPATLSGGMVKRAALARALALDPRVLLLDEPTAGLDPSLADEIDQLVRKMNEALGVTVVLVTHDLTTLFSVCDRVALLAEGRVTVGTPAELISAEPPAGVRAFWSGPRVEAAKAAMATAQRLAKKERRAGPA